MSRFLWEILEFMYAVISYWQAFVTGGFVMAVLFVYERLSGYELPGTFIPWGVVMFFLVSFFLAWREEHRKVLDIQEKLRSDRPSLMGSIEQMFSGSDANQHVSEIYLLMTVRSLGSPSIAEGWRLKIKSDTRDLNLVPTLIPDSHPILAFDKESDKFKEIAVFKHSDGIYDKAIIPIERGALIRGWLRYVIQDIPYEEIQKEGTKLIVTFEDITRRSYEAVYIMKNKDDPGDKKPSYFPGAGQPFKSGGD